MAHFIFQTIYFLLPYALANMAPPINKNVKVLEYPLDFGKKLWGKRILGKNKTWRGLVVAILAGLLGVYIQLGLYNLEFFRNLSFINFSEINIFLYGILIGLGAILGDSAGSFIKRRLGKKPGDSFVPFDQIVGPIGVMILILPIYKVNLTLFITALVFAFIFHILIKHTGYWLKIENKKW